MPSLPSAGPARRGNHAQAEPWLVSDRRAEGVLLTGVYGSGKSSVAQEIAYLLEQQGEPFALLDLDYLAIRN